MNQEQLLKELKRDEGYRRKLYQDSVGKWTIGIGYNIDDLGLPERIIHELYEEMVMVATNDLHKIYPDWMRLPEMRQRVLVNMCYNMGYNRFRQRKWPKFWKAVKADDVEGVCREMRDSRWYSQVGIRADRLIKMWRNAE